MNKKKETNAMILHAYHNVVKCSKGKAEHVFHRLGKWKVCDWLYGKSIDFATEVSFRGGGRADIVIPDWNLAIEILHSEDVENFKKKVYPIPAIPVSSTILNSEVEALMNDLEACQGSNWEYYVKNYKGD